MAQIIALPVATFRHPRPVHVRGEPAEVVAIEGFYFEAARVMRARANHAATMGKPEDAKALRSRSQQLDGIAYAIKAKTDALVRAEARNAVWGEQQLGGGVA